MLAFASLTPSVLAILAWDYYPSVGLILIPTLLVILSMIRIGKSLINLYLDVEDAINKNVGYSLTAYGFFYLLFAILTLFEGQYVSFLGSLVLIASAVLASKRHFILASIGILFSLLSVLMQILMENGVFGGTISYLSIDGLSFLWILPIITFLLTTLLVRTSVKDEKYFSEVNLIK